MGKNVTIYLPDDIFERMSQFPEVNWSEICRRAVVDYIEARSHVDVAAILEKLKRGKTAEYKSGQMFALEIASKINYKELTSMIERESDLKLESAAEKEGLTDYPVATIELRYYWKNILEKYGAKEVANEFANGFRDMMYEINKKT
jgi:hypothetical protein